MNEKITTQPIDDVIRRSYDVPEIRPEFVSALSIDLIQSANEQVAKNTNKIFSLRLGLGFATIALLLGIFFTQAPAGRALAESISRFFKVSTVTEIPISDPNVAATPTYAPTFSITLAPAAIVVPTETPLPTPEGFTLADTQACKDDPYGYTCKMAWLEKKVGFDVKEFPTDPPGMRMDEVTALDGNEVWINYVRVGGGSYLLFSQAMLTADYQPGGQGVPEGTVEEVMVGNYPGEFTAGAYVLKPGETSYKWVAGSKYDLRWSDSERRYEIISYGCNDHKELCTADGLIQLALTLVDEPNSTQALRADYLKSVEEAEEISGLTLLKPGLLPKDFRFDYATYDAEISRVWLRYHPAGYMDGAAEIGIIQSPVDMAALNPDRNGLEIKGETVEINGVEGIYYAFDPFNHSVIWQSNGMNVWLWVTSSDLWYGGSFTREQVLEIARSVK